MRRFHSPATHTLVTTDSHKRELEAWGLGSPVVWGRGVDTHQFRPGVRGERERPRLLYVGRIAVEKNIDAFLSLDMDADKVVVGDGPLRKGAAAPLSGGRLEGLPLRPGTRRSLCRRRRLRLSVADRYVRAGDVGGHGVWHVGGSVSRDGTQGCRDRICQRRTGPRLGQSGTARPSPCRAPRAADLR